MRDERRSGIVRAPGDRTTNGGTATGQQNTRRTEYLSYLLRLWQVSVDGLPVWRVALQQPGDAGQRTFSGLDELLAFLRAKTAESGEGPAVDEEAPM